MVKNFYIFRHGQSTYNVEGRIQGHTNNSVLTDFGLEQAYATADNLKNKNVEIVISSPLRRAKQTGNIVSKTIKVPLQYDERFTEVNVGEAEGLLYTQAMQKFGNLYQKWRNSNPQNDDIHFENGETKRQVRQRIFSALEQYAQSKYNNIAISGHGITLQETLNALHIDREDIDNGEIIHLQYDNNNWHFIGCIKSLAQPTPIQA